MNPIDQAIILEEAKRYTDSQQLARIEKKTITWDGDTTGRETIDMGSDGLFVKIADYPIDLSALSRFVMVANDSSSGETVTVEVPDKQLGVSTEGNISVLYDTNYGEGDYVYILASSTDSDEMGFTTGTWYCHRTESGVTLLRVIIETETIHPIDPKYLPGVCLPVVELETGATAEGAVLTEDEAAKMDKAVAMGTPVVVSFMDEDASFNGVFSRVKHPNFLQMQYSIGADMFVIMRIDETGQWTFHYVAGE